MLLSIMGTIPETFVRHYVAETCLAVDYLHMHRIVHRNIKTDSLLITSSGHVKLTNFEIATVMPRRSATNVQYQNHHLTSFESDNVNGLDRSVLSTHEDSAQNMIMNSDNVSDENWLSGVFGNVNYLAPEILLIGLYDEKVDWWAVGVLTFHLLYGFTPFEDVCFGGGDEETVTNICFRRVEFPVTLNNLSRESKSFILELLVVDPYERLGGHTSVKPALMHDFLIDVDVNTLLTQPGPIFRY